MDHFSASTYKYSAGTVAVGTNTIFFAKAPADAAGGAVTITEAYAVSDTALGAGSAWNLELVTASSGAVSAINGTIGLVDAGSAWSAGTARTITISDGFVDGGEYIGAKFIGTALSVGGGNVTVFINGVMGR